MQRKIGGVTPWFLKLLFGCLAYLRTLAQGVRSADRHVRTRCSIPFNYFRGHFLNDQRLSRAGLLVLALTLAGSPRCAGGEDQEGPLGALLSYLTSDYTVPEPYLLSEAATIRLTQHGFDTLTGQIKSLISLMFPVDDQGRVVIRLGDFIQTIPFAQFDGGSLGSFKTTLDVSSLIVTVDWSKLQLELVEDDVPGASVKFSMEGAKIGVVAGEIAGFADYTVLGVSGVQQVACGVANGLGDPADAIAEFSFSAVVHIQTDGDGRLILQTEVLSLSIDALDLGVTTPCEAAACGPGNDVIDALFDTPCEKCALICDALDTLSATALPGLVALLSEEAIQPLLVQTIDTLVSGLAQELLAGTQIRLGGEIDIQELIDMFLPTLANVFPGLHNLGFSLAPAGETFAVRLQGLELELQGGLAPIQSHVCTSHAVAEPDFSSVPQGGVPVLDGLVVTPSGPVAYDLAAAIPQRLLNEVIWSVFRSGAMCIRVDSAQIEDLLGLTLSAAVLDLLLPGLRGAVGERAPLIVVLEPGFDAADLPLVTLGQAPHMQLTLPKMAVSLYVQSMDRAIRLFSVKTDVYVGANFVIVGPNQLQLSLASLTLGETLVTYNELVPHANLDAIVPFVVEVGLSVLLGGFDTLTLDLGPIVGGATESIGFPLIPIIESVQATGQSAVVPDWLALYLRFVPKVEMALTYQCQTVATIVDPPVGTPPGTIMVDVGGCGKDGEFQWRVDGSIWRDFSPGSRLVIVHPALMTSGHHRIDIRGRKPGQWRTLDPSYTTVLVDGLANLKPEDKKITTGNPKVDLPVGCSMPSWPISTTLLVLMAAVVAFYRGYSSRRGSD